MKLIEFDWLTSFTKVLGIKSQMNFKAKPFVELFLQKKSYGEVTILLLILS